MEERNVKLSLEKARQWYKQGGELKEVALQAYTEQELKDNHPHSWEEFCKNYSVKKGDSYVSWTIGQGYTLEKHIECNKNYCSSEEVKAFHALIQLRQLRKVWIGDWEPDWNNTPGAILQEKHCIFVDENNIIACPSIYTQHSMSFPTSEMANEFRHDFEDLLKQAKLLL